MASTSALPALATQATSLVRRVPAQRPMVLTKVPLAPSIHTATTFFGSYGDVPAEGDADVVNVTVSVSVEPMSPLAGGVARSAGTGRPVAEYGAPALIHDNQR